MLDLIDWSFGRSVGWLVGCFIYLFYYLRQVNELNGRDNVFVRSVCVSVCVCAQRTGQSDQFKTVKARDFKFDMHVPTDGTDILGTQEICCPKCHFSSVQNHQFRPKFRPNF